ncbi:MAG: hypothetical protein ACREK6_06180 [Candidatus Rokuibacteriota bacterium]
MVGQRLARLRYHGGAAFLVTLAVIAVVLTAASVPHTHVTVKPGLYNQEHDLSYLAALGGVAPLEQAVSAAAPVLVVTDGFGAADPALVSRVGRHPDPRAPPLR